MSSKQAVRTNPSRGSSRSAAAAPAPHKPKPKQPASRPYKHANTTTQTTAAEVAELELVQAWCVQFALPPSLEHTRGGGACWFPETVAEAAVEFEIEAEIRRVEREEEGRLMQTEKGLGEVFGFERDEGGRIIEKVIGEVKAKKVGEKEAGERGRGEGEKAKRKDKRKDKEGKAGKERREREQEKKRSTGGEDFSEIMTVDEVFRSGGIGPDGKKGNNQRGNGSAVVGNGSTNGFGSGSGGGNESGVAGGNGNGAAMNPDTSANATANTPAAERSHANGNGIGNGNGNRKEKDTEGPRPDVEMVDAVNGLAPDPAFMAESSAEIPLKRDWVDVYATGCLNKIRVYRANRGAKPTLLQVYEDPDSQEQYYSLTWTYNAARNEEWWIAAAGRNGVIRILNVTRCRLEKTLTGHGSSINHVTTHPRDSSLILTASKDESLRMWNLRTSSTVAIYAGLRGHRGEVVGADFHHSGSKFASCGIDNSIRVWEVSRDENVKAAIMETHLAANRGITDVAVYYDEHNRRKKASVPIIQFPTACYSNVHKHYVDCVSWVGDLIMSKSLHCGLLLWEPLGYAEGLASPASEFCVIMEYKIEHASAWFIRFGFDSSRQMVACGNEHGVVYVFKIDDFPSRVQSVVWPSKKSGNSKPPTDNNAVRQCAFNHDASILLAVEDNSSVSQYERDD